MAHSHSHTSSHLPEDNNARRLLYAFGVTAGFMLVEVIGGFLSGSLALLADAGHMLTDTAALLFALLAVQFSRRPPTIRHTFGWLRLTTLAAFVNAIALVVITILIVWEAIERFRTPRPVEGGMMMAIAVAGLLANILSFWLLHHGSEEKNLNVRAAALHVLGDLLGSVGAIIAALIIIWTGWTPADPILSILVSLLVLRSAWRLLKDSVNEFTGIAGYRRTEASYVPGNLGSPQCAPCTCMDGRREAGDDAACAGDPATRSRCLVRSDPTLPDGSLSD